MGGSQMQRLRGSGPLAQDPGCPTLSRETKPIATGPVGAGAAELDLKLGGAVR